MAPSAAALEGREEEALAVMRRGDHLGKYGRQGTMKTRTFALSADGKALEYRGKGGQTQLPLLSVTQLSAGRETFVFRSKDGDMYGSNPERFRHLSAISFSLHYDEPDGTYRTLDLQCLGNERDRRTPEQQFVLWFHGLGSLVRPPPPPAPRCLTPENAASGLRSACEVRADQSAANGPAARGGGPRAAGAPQPPRELHADVGAARQALARRRQPRPRQRRQQPRAAAARPHLGLRRGRHLHDGVQRQRREQPAGHHERGERAAGPRRAARRAQRAWRVYALARPQQHLLHQRRLVAVVRAARSARGVQRS